MPSALALCAHPDDIEFMMAGTLVLLRDAGYEIHYMTLADGSCGSMETDAATTARIRGEEARAAAHSIGAVYHAPLCRDLEVFYAIDTLRALAAVVRTIAPEIILTHPPQDYMEDHMNTCRLALTAAFARGMPNFATMPATAPVQQPVTVYLAMPYGLRDPLGKPVTAELYVDVSGVLQTKRAMLALHASQKQWLDTSQGLNSYLTHMEELSGAMGALSGSFAFAEGWTRHLPAGYCAEDADPLRQALGALVT